MMPDLFTKDLGWKLFSLFLAVAIWFTVNRILHEANLAQSPNTGTSLTYDNLPLSIVSAAADVRDFRVVPTAVKVTINGPADIMNTLQIGQVHAVVNLTATNLTRNSRLPVEISAPANVTITGIDPASVLIIIPPAPEKK